jgi:hypothetical protein
MARKLHLILGQMVSSFEIQACNVSIIIKPPKKKV